MNIIPGRGDNSKYTKRTKQNLFIGYVCSTFSKALQIVCLKRDPSVSTTRLISSDTWSGKKYDWNDFNVQRDTFHWTRLIFYYVTAYYGWFDFLRSSSFFIYFLRSSSFFFIFFFRSSSFFIFCWGRLHFFLFFSFEVVFIFFFEVVFNFI